ncbi:LOW QUALITY PROTEIN: serine/threonine-protein phosphatase 4 regulatory subunit 1-like [Macrobrachium nipponense]|uniref:LOW QUALITY PROTEIN: serine/threonine-protein phosphatase 4 regulatory subunit 1-like n=1 Tax=Macrobrachium nipponense TaxID=159736 RepID=UPI0030C7D3CC
MADIYFFTDEESESIKEEDNSTCDNVVGAEAKDQQVCGRDGQFVRGRVSSNSGGGGGGGGGSSDDEDEEEEEEEEPQGGVEDEGCHSGEEDAATPLARLLKCAHSDNYFDRYVCALEHDLQNILASPLQMVARSIQETLRAVVTIPNDVNTVLQIMHSLSSNDEPAVRTELMEQVPQIAVLCHEFPEHLGGVVANHLVPMVVKYLTDPNNQVRKTSQAALLVLLEQELVSRTDVHDQVCPVILELTFPDAMDEFKTEAVALMAKMAPLIGKEMTERLFLERFTRLCSDALFQVRKVCASNFGDFCSVVGSQPTEEVLVSKFVCLCEDGVWGVRKACAEVFMGVSCACSLETRKNKLSPVFVSLLTDQSRWVRVAAFQNLGPFISTFADASVTGLHYNEDGVLVIGTPQIPSSYLTKEKNCSTQERGDSESEEDKKEKAKTSSDSLPPPEQQDYGKGEADGGGTSGIDCLESEPMDVEELNEPSDTVNPDPVHSESAEERRARAYLFASIEENSSSNEVEAITSTSTSLSTKSSSPSFPQQSTLSQHEVNVQSSVPAIPPNTLPSPVDGVQSQSNSLTVSGTEGHLHVHLDNNPAFNTFNYWRTPIMPIELPIPQIEVDIDIMGQTTNVCVKAKVQENNGTYQSQVNLTMATDTENPNITLASSSSSPPSSNTTTTTTTPQQEKQPRLDKEPGATVEADLEALAASLEGVTTSESSTDDECTGDVKSINQESESADVVRVTGPQQQATYAQVCAASVTSVQHKNDPQPSILASRLTQARVSMSGGTVTELKKREMDVVSPSDCSVNMPNSGQSLPPQPSLLSQRRSDPFAGIMDSPDGIFSATSEQMSSAITDHSTGSSEFSLYQDIVPKTLLEHYISMTDPVRAETVDNELTRHCAYSLPAVALTLGRENWPVLKDTYETLAGDMHWKVRRTLAFSIHELAVILGEEISQSDLVPVFNGFIKDLDEVRIGVLKHLAHFLRLLKPRNRREYLPRMDEFLRTDNENNWRFRLELAIQLSDIIDLFSADDCLLYLVPIALILMADKVVHIRRTCYNVVCQLVRQLGCEGDPDDIVDLSQQLRETFAQSTTWSRRQSYAFLSGQLVAERSLPVSDWCRLFLPDMLMLANDKVPNVRIAVAKMLATHINCLDYCQNPENYAAISVQETIKKLQQDEDRDVVHFARFPVSTETLIPQDPSL